MERIDEAGEFLSRNLVRVESGLYGETETSWSLARAAAEVPVLFRAELTVDSDFADLVLRK